jgi:hypothetical protein
VNGLLYRYFEQDHRRLERLLAEACAKPDAINIAAFDQFRSGILKHIGMEEKILIPAFQRFSGGVPFPLAAKIRLDHGAIAALMVPPPSMTIIRALRAILAAHNVLEESLDGLYEACENSAGPELDAIMKQVMSTPDVPVMPYNHKPEVLEATRRALARAGYNFDDYL